MIPLVMSTFGMLGPSAESYLQSLADVACSTGFIDCGVWLRIAKQFLRCALVRGRGIVFRHYYKSIAKCAGKDYRDGAVVPFGSWARLARLVGPVSWYVLPTCSRQAVLASGRPDSQHSASKRFCTHPLLPQPPRLSSSPCAASSMSISILSR